MKSFNDFVATLDEDFYNQSISTALKSSETLEGDANKIIHVSYAMAINLLAKYHSWLSEQNNLE